MTRLIAVGNGGERRGGREEGNLTSLKTSAEAKTK